MGELLGLQGMNKSKRHNWQKSDFGKGQSNRTGLLALELPILLG